MTDDAMVLRRLLEKTSDAELLREMIGFAAERLMAMEVAGLTGAAPGERSESRINQRMATASATDRPAPARSSCASRSCAGAAASRLSWSPAGPPRRP